MLQKSETCSKPPKHVFCCTAEFAFIKPSTNSEDLLNITKTPYLTISIDLLK